MTDRPGSETRSVGRPALRFAASVMAVVIGLGLWSGAALAAGSADPCCRSSAEAARLVRRAAAGDQAAVAELRRVRDIGGRPVDLSGVLEGNTSERRQRLTALAERLDGAEGGVSAESSRSSIDPAKARRSAEAVLAAEKYKDHQLPRPFKGAIGWLADRLRPVGRPLAALGRGIVRYVLAPPIRAILGLPGGRFILGALVAVLGGVVVAWLGRRSSRASVAEPRSSSGLVDLSRDPADLDREAEAAEAAGELEQAVRLRYEAGLIRLVRAKRIELRAATTARDVAGQVGGPVIAELTSTFEEVVYGERAATSDDISEARRGWAELLGARGASR